MESGNYLLYDGGCPKCTRLAKHVAAASDGRLAIADLRDPEFRQRLAEIRPDWRFEPTLLMFANGKGRAVTGFWMRLRLLRLLGLRRAMRVAAMAARGGVPIIGIGTLGSRPRPIFPDEIDLVGPETWVRLRPGQRWNMAVADDVVKLTFQGKEVEMPAHVAYEIQYIAEHGDKRFAASSIPGDLDEPGRVVLVRVLLRTGFLVPAEYPVTSVRLLSMTGRWPAMTWAGEPGTI
jgi:hypothetical protein